jgi:hypothetical protein
VASVNYICVLDDAGAAYCWGDNDLGQLGDGNLDNPVPLPTAVDTSGDLDGKAIAQMSAVWDHTCAVEVSGAIYCSGYNYYGQLGEGFEDAGSDVPVLAGPHAPGNVVATAGNTTATVSWSAPADLDGGMVTGFVATATPGGGTCATSGANICTISGLSNGTTYQVTVIVQTTAGDSGASTPAEVTPASTLAFSSAAQDTVAFGVPFSFGITATGSPGTVITSSGGLPPGARFARGAAGGTATIYGKPVRSAAGDYHLTLTAKDTTGTAVQAFTLTVTRPPAISKVRSATVQAGSAVSMNLTAAGYPAPVLAESGLLPGGLSFTGHSDGTAALSGTLTAGSGGRYRITVTAHNAVGDASRSFTLTVFQPPAITSTDAASASAGPASVSR